MSLDTDKQAVLDFLDKALLRIEQARASYVNGDYDKSKARILQFDDEFKNAEKLLGIVQLKKALKDKADSTKDDLSK